MRRKKKVYQGTLFPFVSVLICVIGALSFLIVASGLASSIDAKLDLIHTGDSILLELNQAENERDFTRAQLNEYRTMITEADEVRESLFREREQIRKVSDQIAQARSREITLRQNLTRAERDRTALTQRLEKVSLLARKSKVHLSVRGGQSEYNPLFVECRENGLLILANQKPIGLSDIRDSRYLKEILDSISGDDKWCLFLVVRQGGVPAFNIIYDLSRGKVPLGFQPVLSSSDLDVSQWPRPDWLG